MSIVAFRSFQDKGKTSLMTLLAKQFLLIGLKYGDAGLNPNDVVANYRIMWPGVHIVNNSQMRQYLRAMVKHGIKHKLVLIDEADRVFPARFWQNEQQTESMIGLWQDIKSFNNVFYTAHKGTSVDIILREVTQVEYYPDYDKKTDRLYYVCINAICGRSYRGMITDFSKKIFKDYDRWEISGESQDIVTAANDRAKRTDSEGCPAVSRETQGEGDISADLPPSSLSPA